MAIRSDIFGGVHLTGKDADKFERQVKYGRPGPAAQRTLQRGDELLNSFNDKDKAEGTTKSL